MNEAEKEALLEMMGYVNIKFERRGGVQTSDDVFGRWEHVRCVFCDGKGGLHIGPWVRDRSRHAN